jgi:hypothetical protein
MEQLFFSNNNFNLIREVLDSTCKRQYSFSLNEEHTDKIGKIMKYVRSRVSSEVPDGHTLNSYTQLMNKKVLDLSMETLKDENDRYKLSVPKKPATKYSTLASNIFDQNIVINDNMPNDFLPPPEIQNQNKSDVPILQQLETINEYRSDLDPKIKKIDFSINTNENDMDQNKLLQDMIEKRGIPMGNPVELSTNNINKNVIQPDAGITHTEPADIHNVNQVINSKLDTALEHMSSYDDGDQMSTSIENLRENERVQENFSVDLKSDFDGLPNNLDRNNIDLMIEKSDDPQNMFYDKDKAAEEELHKINTKTLNQHYESPVILPKQVKSYLKDYYVTIDSRDRNLEIYPNPSNFQVKFSPASDSIEKQAMVDNNNNIIYETTVRFLGNLSGASIGRTYTNINEIKLLHCIVPLGINWVCGKSPSNYYNGNCSGQTDNNLCIPYGPVYTEDTGIAISVINEPYLLLDIDEIEGPYDGTNDINTNAFAKLVLSSDWRREYHFSQVSSFVYMSTAGNETYKYNPTNLASLDKMTLSLKKHDSELYIFGNDKLYVKYIIEGSTNKKTCNKNVKIVVQQKHKDYMDCMIEDINIAPGELLYFYDTRPDEAHMIKFHKDIHISCIDILSKRELNKYSLGICNGITSETSGGPNCNISKIKNNNNNFTNVGSNKYVKIQAKICKIENITDNQSELLDEECNYSPNYFVDFNNFLQVGNYLAIVYKNLDTGETYSELLKVYCINGYDVITIKPKDYDPSAEHEILRFGFAENYNRGITTKDKNSLFSYSGKRACCVKKQCTNKDSEDNSECSTEYDEDTFSFEIDFPYENLPEYIKKKQYFENEIFFIQQKSQISYTFRVTETRKEDIAFNSLLTN